MAFMQPQITDKAVWLQGEAKDGGTYYAPFDQCSVNQFKTDVLGYSEEDEYNVEVVTGYGVRLSAPGFMDCTDWEVFTKHDYALERYNELKAEGDE
jgi:hypothetical protein